MSFVYGVTWFHSHLPRFAEVTDPLLYMIYLTNSLGVPSIWDRHDCEVPLSLYVGLVHTHGVDRGAGDSYHNVVGLDLIAPLSWSCLLLPRPHVGLDLTPFPLILSSPPRWSISHMFSSSSRWSHPHPHVSFVVPPLYIISPPKKIIPLHPYCIFSHSR